MNFAKRTHFNANLYSLWVNYRHLLLYACPQKQSFSAHKKLDLHIYNIYWVPNEMGNVHNPQHPKTRLITLVFSGRNHQNKMHF